MKIESIKNPIFENVSISKVFFTDYLMTMPPEAVKLYVYICYLYECGGDFDVKMLAKSLRMSEDSVEDLLTLLHTEKLITVNSDRIVLQDLSEAELERLYTLKTAINPADSDLNDEKAKEFNKMLKSVSNKFFAGTMPSSWCNQIRLWHESFGFNTEVIFLLFQHCEMQRKMTMNYVRAVAEAWHNAGIKTEEDVEKYISDYEDFEKLKTEIKKKLGIRRNLNEYEEDIIRKWHYSYGYGMDIIEIALKKSIYNQSASLGTFDAAISRWHENGLKTVFAVQEFEAQKKQRYAEMRGKKYKAEGDAAIAAAKKAGVSLESQKDSKSVKTNFTGHNYSDEYFDSKDDEGILSDEENKK